MSVGSKQVSKTTLIKKVKINVTTKMILYHCLSRSAMYKQKKSLLQITLLEQPQPIK